MSGDDRGSHHLRAQGLLGIVTGPVAEEPSESPLVGLGAGELPGPERLHGRDEAVAGPGALTLGDVAVEDDERGLGDRLHGGLVPGGEQPCGDRRGQRRVVGEHHVLLGAEVAEEGGAADLRALRDVVDGRGVEALGLEELEGGVAEPLGGAGDPHAIDGGTEYPRTRY